MRITNTLLKRKDHFHHQSACGLRPQQRFGWLGSNLFFSQEILDYEWLTTLVLCEFWWHEWETNRGMNMGQMRVIPSRGIFLRTALSTSEWYLNSVLIDSG